MANVAKIQAVLDLDAGRFHGQITSASGKVRQFGSTVKSADKDIRAIRHSVTGFGAGLRDTMVVLGQFRAAMHTVWMFTGRWVGEIINANAKLERLQVLMKGMSKGADEIERSAGAIRDMNYVLDKARKAPFALDEIADSFVKIKSTGIDPMAGALDALTNGVAAFGGNDQIMHRATIAIQQMAGKGVISMEELRQQLGEAIPNAMRLMGRSMGISMGEMQKQISLGRVEARSALAGLFREFDLEFSGKAEDLMKTWVGMVAKLKTEWLLFAQAIGDAGLFEEAKRALKGLTEFIASPAGKAFAREVGQSLAAAARHAADLLSWLIKNYDQIIEIGKVVAMVFAAGKIFTFTRAIMGTLAGLSSFGTGMLATKTAIAAATTAGAKWSAWIGGLAGPIGIAVAALGLLVGEMYRQKAAADRAAASMRDYYRATANGELVSPEEHAEKVKALQGIRSLQGRLDEIGSSNAKGLRGQAVALRQLADEMVAAGTASEELQAALDPTRLSLLTPGKLRGLISQSLKEEYTLAHAVVEQGTLQLGQRVSQSTSKVMSDIDRGLGDVARAGMRGLDEMYTKLNNQEITKEEFGAYRLERERATFEAQKGMLESLRAEYQKGMGLAKTSEDLRMYSGLVDEVGERLVTLQDTYKSATEQFKAGPVLLDAMGQGGKDKKDQKPPLLSFLEQVSGKNAQLKAELEGNIPTLEKFNKLLAMGAYGPADAGMVGQIRAILAANEELAASIKKHKATEKLQGELEEMAASSAADVISAKLESTGDMYSQVSAGMVGFNRKVEIARAGLDKTNMTMDEFNEHVKEIRKNVAQVDLIGLTRYVEDRAWNAYLDSLPEHTRHLEEMNRAMAENRKMIDQFKANDGDPANDAIYDALGARNAATIAQEYKNATRPAWKTMLDDWSDLTGNMNDVWSDGLQSISDTLVELVTTGKASFRDLASSIIKEMTRVLMNKAIAQLIGYFMGGFGSFGQGTAVTGGASLGYTPSAMGNVMTDRGPMKLESYASGGIARSPQLSLFGEGRQPEAYVPLPDGRTIPVTMSGGGGGFGDIQINVTIASDGSAEEDTTGQGEQGAQLGQLLKAKIKTTLQEEMMPGGMIYNMRHR